MKLTCSRGHIFNTSDVGHRVTFGDNRLVPGGRCPMVMSYDRMSGNSYCGRVLKKVGVRGPIVPIDARTGMPRKGRWVRGCWVPDVPIQHARKPQSNPDFDPNAGWEK